jgi:hypothetical protein
MTCGSLFQTYGQTARTFFVFLNYLGSSAIIVGKSPATKQQNIFMFNKNKIFSSWGDIWVALGFNLEGI